MLKNKLNVGGMAMDDNVLETKKIGNYTVNVVQDIDMLNPREDWDNSTTMMCAHSRYRLGDENIHSDYNVDDYNGWDELSDAISKDKGFIASLPLYLYDHSGITISTKPFSCNFDSGMIGMIGITREQMKEMFGWNNLSKDRLENLNKTMIADVKIYDQYLTGAVYGYEILKDDEVIDSCWGFYDEPSKVLGIAVNECEGIVERDKQIKVDSLVPSI